MATHHLYRWSLIQEVDDPYKPPEQKVAKLVGFKDQNKSPVKTSAIVEVNGREVVTYSGSIYILEDIDPNYLKFLDDTGEVYDPENPIRFKC